MPIKKQRPLNLQHHMKEEAGPQLSSSVSKALVLVFAQELG